MSTPQNDHDLLPEQTEGFKVGEKKTMDEINKLGKPTIKVDVFRILAYGDVLLSSSFLLEMSITENNYVRMTSKLLS